MKSLAALIVLGLLAGSAPAGEISRSTLAAIGLPGFAKMSQADAMHVRGKGYTHGGYTISVSGSSWANVPGGAGSTNSYSASQSGSGGSHGASGYNVSGALGGGAIITSHGSVGIVYGAIAGGTSGVSVH